MSGIESQVVTSGAGTINLTADDVSFDNAVTLISAATVTVTPQTSNRAINLGTETAGQLSLTAAELANIIAGTLQIGDASSGAITVSDATGNRLESVPDWSLDSQHPNFAALCW